MIFFGRRYAYYPTPGYIDVINLLNNFRPKTQLTHHIMQHEKDQVTIV
jgi:hypothetical protein